MSLILVTGGAGYIGSHVVRQLSEAGHEVVVYDNLSTGCRESLINGERLIVADLADTTRIRGVLAEIGCTTVLHFAAAIVAPESVRWPLKYYENNTRNTLNLLQACVDHGIERLIFSSTAAVYGMTGEEAASENCATVPINPYGSSKLMSEWMLRDAAKAHGFSYAALRYFNVAGADPLGRMGHRTREATHLIKVACQAALGLRDSVSIFGTDYDTPDGTGIRDYIHIEDLAAAHLGALEYLERGGPSTVVNVGYGRGSSVREVIDLVKAASGVDFPVLLAPRREGDPARVIAGADRIRSLFGWSPSHEDLAATIADAWRWEKKLFTAQH